LLINNSYYFDESFCQNIEVSAYVNNKVAIVNQELNLTIEIKGTQNQPEEIILPDLSADFIIAGKTGSQTSIQIINGAITASVSFSYVLIPKHTGKVTIAPVKIKHKGKEYLTKPVEIEVIKPADVPKRKSERSAGESGVNLNESLIVLAIPDKKVVYQNEGFTISYKLLFSQVSINTYGIKKAPATTGFWVEEYPMPRNPVVRRETIKNRLFQTAIIKQIELFPTKSGELQVDPLVVEFEIKAPRKKRTRDFFDSFFEDPFFERTIRKTVASNSLKIKVLPLPEENKPESFTGLVGDFKIRAEVDKKEVAVNEAISLKIKIFGQGNIKLITEPEINLPSGFEKYEPKIEEHIQRNNNTIMGEKTFEYVLIPRISGLKKIKPISISYFNPSEKRYISVSTNEIAVNVIKGKENVISSVPSNLTKEELKILGTDVRFIKGEVTKWSKAGDIFYKNPLFFILLIIPVVIASGSYLYQQHLEKLDTDESYKRNRRAYGLATRRLKKACSLINEKSKSEFYAEISRSVTGFIADKLNMPEAGLVTDDIKVSLKNKNIDDDTINKIISFLQACDFSRFAPSEVKIEDMEKELETARSIISTLDKKLK